MFGRIAAIALACFALDACSSHPPQSAQIAPSASPPRGVAVYAWSPSDRIALFRELDVAFARVRGSTGNGLVVLAADGTKLYDRNGDAPRAPASTLKTLTAATALDILGARHRFVTRLVSYGEHRGPTLLGNVWLIGGGDPVLSTNDLRDAAKTLRRDGITAISGRVLVDASAFHGPAQNPRWSADDLNLDYAAGTSALSLDEDVATVVVTPAHYGAPAFVHFDPNNRIPALHGAIMTSGSSNIHIDHERGRDIFTLAGTIAAGNEQRFPIPMGDVAEYSAGVLDGVLRDAGVRVAQSPGVGVAPFGATAMWTHVSPPLLDIAHHMLVESDNHVAETLLRILATTDMHAGTEYSGIRVEERFLARNHISSDGLHIYDGSGLAPSDRIAPMTLAEILANGGADNALDVALPRVGVEGTVRGHRLTAAAGRVRAKSGHIGGVDGLAGVIKTRHHGPLYFAFIGNDADDGVIEDADDQALDELSNF